MQPERQRSHELGAQRIFGHQEEQEMLLGMLKPLVDAQVAANPAVTSTLSKRFATS